MATIRAEHHSIPLRVPLGDDNLASVSAAFLAMRFGFHLDSIHVEEEVFDDAGDLSHTVFQMSFHINNGRVWFLLPGTYKAMGVTESDMAASTVLLTPGGSTTSTAQVPLPATVKKEPGIEEVTLLSDSDDDLVRAPEISTTTPPPTQQQPFSDPLKVSQSPSVSQPSSSKPPIHPSVSRDRPSVVECLKLLASRPGSKNILKKIDYQSVRHEKVEFLPSVFDGDIIFEFPPIGRESSHSHARFMFGMDKRFDGHAWCRTKTSNISNDLGLTFRSSCCVGHLRCDNMGCDYLNRPNRPTDVNETEWEGCTASPFHIGGDPPPGSSLVCKVCKTPPSCLDSCPAKMYYVLGKGDMTRACIHLGHHHHPVSHGVCRQSKVEIVDLIGREVERTPTATNSAIALAASKEFLAKYLLRSDDDPTKVMDLQSMKFVMDRYQHLSTPTIRNTVTSFKRIARGGIIDSITGLRGQSSWPYVQENKFPG